MYCRVHIVVMDRKRIEEKQRREGWTSLRECVRVLCWRERVVVMFHRARSQEDTAICGEM